MRLGPVLALFALISPILALDGKVGIHDPSTIIKCNDKYYVYGTGGTALVSDDGWAWRASTPLPVRELAPDVIHLSTTRHKSPDAEGFIPCWLILEPIPVTGPTEGAVRDMLKKEYFPDHYCPAIS